MASDKSQEENKKVAALAALKEVKGGMKVGLGTGSTANYFIEELGKRKYPGQVVASSVATEALAKKYGLKLTTIDELLKSYKPDVEERGIIRTTVEVLWEKPYREITGVETDRLGRMVLTDNKREKHSLTTSPDLASAVDSTLKGLMKGANREAVPVTA